MSEDLGGKTHSYPVMNWVENTIPPLVNKSNNKYKNVFLFSKCQERESKLKLEIRFLRIQQ
jgi:hypothetical protein